MPQRMISAGDTIFRKFVFPVIWTGFFASGTVSMFLTPERWAADPPPRWEFVAATIGGMLFLLLLYGPLKTVAIRVPACQVLDVIESMYGYPRRVTIHFNGDTPFGRRVVFLPSRVRFVLPDPWPHPIVVELQKLAGHDRG